MLGWKASYFGTLSGPMANPWNLGWIRRARGNPNNLSSIHPRLIFSFDRFGFIIINIILPSQFWTLWKENEYQLPTSEYFQTAFVFQLCTKSTRKITLYHNRNTNNNNNDNNNQNNYSNLDSPSPSSLNQNEYYSKSGGDCIVLYQARDVQSWKEIEYSILSDIALKHQWQMVRCFPQLSNLDQIIAGIIYIIHNEWMNEE